ncbi:MAG: GatB/YqeY domain-containing protein [Patescibacteria group bacterium]|nr:GatB/YqeY domain-containing protein [Patescibacteria group bacterium]
MIETQLEQDIKTALLAGDKDRVLTLRMLKSAVLSAKVAGGSRDSIMPDAEVVALFSKEAKKRQESAELYKQGGNDFKAEAELAEKALIETYLPAQLSEAEVITVVEAVIADLGDTAAMGPVIGQVKAKTNGAADGALIAKLVKEKLAK